MVAGAPPNELALAIFMPLLVGIYALPGFIVAMLIFAWPAWAALHLVGFRSWKVAGVAGATGALIVSVLFMAALGDWSFGGLVWLILPGALASLTVWKLAYGQRIRPPPAPSSAAPTP
ncbi:MAG: hypothetical protein EON89_06145 [Brevundimonas sp.]|nr:MAG: hypothetical protein EON89_06145 [Brevundimonas sp.]